MPSSCWRRRPPTSRIRPSRSCSSQTEYLAGLGAMLATRRRRAPDEQEIWAAHLASSKARAVGKPEFETDRARFLGRGHGIRTPIAVIDGRPLSEHRRHGARPDLRPAPPGPRRAGRDRAHRLLDDGRAIAAKQCSTLSTSIATSAPSSGRPRWPGPRRRCSSIISASTPRGRACSSASPATCCTPTRRCGRPRNASCAAPVRSRGSGRMGISGDLPIVLLRIADIEDLDIARQLLQAHEYWRMKQLAVDLVILNERASSYVQDLQIALETLVRSQPVAAAGRRERRAGRVFVLRADLIPPETRALLASVARVRAGRPTRQPRRSARPRAGSRTRPAARATQAAASPSAHRRSRPPPRRSSSSTGSAASPRTAANT